MNSDLQPILAADATIAAISSLLDAKQSSIDTLTQQVGDLTNGGTAMQDQVTALQKQVSDLQAAHNADVLAVQTLTDQHAADAQMLQSLNDQLSAQTASLAKLQTALAAAELSTLASMTCYQGMQRWAADTGTSKEQLGIWIDSGGHTAQSSPGTSTIPHGTFTWKPGDDAAPARMDFKPAAGWDDIFIYERFPLPQTLPTFVVDKRTFSMTAADRAAVNCVEWQQEFKWNRKVYNCGWQWNFTAKMFRIFDFTSKNWKQVNVPFVDMPANTPVSIMTEHALDEANGTTTHLAITINGTRYPVNITQPATPTSIANKYTVSIFQLDSDSKGDPFGLNIHRVEARHNAVTP